MLSFDSSPRETKSEQFVVDSISLLFLKFMMGAVLLVVVAAMATVTANVDPATSPAAPPPAARPWFNTTLPLDARLEALVAAMNTTELIWQLAKGSPPVARLGVPGYAWHMEAAHGVATGGSSTVFPCSLARAATFDVVLEEEVARATAVEARAKWNIYRTVHGKAPGYTAEGLSLTLYAPEMNLCRDPRWGRCQESRGEDPHLTSMLVGPSTRALHLPS